MTSETSASEHGRTSDIVVLNGKWEQSTRSLASAAILGLLIIGLIYFNGQLLLTVGMLIPSLLSSPAEIDEEIESPLFFIGEYSTELRVGITISQFLFMLVPVLLLVRRWHTTDVRKYLRLRPGTVTQILVAIGATLMIIPLGNYVASELSSRLDIPDELASMATELFTASSMAEYVSLLFVVAVTPAICEEVFFRGYVQRTLERTMGWRSLIVVGFIFGLFHLQPIGLVATTVMGILFGYLFYRSKSLGPPMAAHFANNALVVSLLYFRPSVGGIDVATSETFPFAWVLLTLPIGAGLLVLFHRITANSAGEDTPLTPIPVLPDAATGHHEITSPSDEGSGNAALS